MPNIPTPGLFQYYPRDERFHKAGAYLKSAFLSNLDKETSSAVVSLRVYGSAVNARTGHARFNAAAFRWGSAGCWVPFGFGTRLSHLLGGAGCSARPALPGGSALVTGLGAEPAWARGGEQGKRAPGTPSTALPCAPRSADARLRLFSAWERPVLLSEAVSYV